MCLLNKRAFLCDFTFTAIKKICKEDGFSYRMGKGDWTKQMAVD